jgi:hypothetical protein
MSEQSPEEAIILYASGLIEKLFGQILLDSNKYNPDVVRLVKSHLGVNSPHSKAGNNLANDLIELAKNRAEENKK